MCDLVYTDTTYLQFDDVYLVIATQYFHKIAAIKIDGDLG